MTGEIIEFVRLNKYRIWKLLQPAPPPIYQRDRLTVVKDRPEKERDWDKNKDN